MIEIVIQKAGAVIFSARLPVEMPNFAEVARYALDQFHREFPDFDLTAPDVTLQFKSTNA